MDLIRQFLQYLLRSGARSRRYLLSVQGWRTRLILWLGAITVGATAALFARVAEAAMHGFQWMLQHSVWLALVISPAGLVLAVWLTRRFFSGAEGSGIPQTIAVVSTTLRDQRLRLLSIRRFMSWVCRFSGFVTGCS